MADTQAWTVKSNSFRPDYTISGETLILAVQRSFERIARDVLRANASGYRIKAVWAEYRPGILRGRGGVELTIEHQVKAPKGSREDAGTERAVVWIHARPEDMKKRHDFSLPLGSASAA